MPFPTSRETNRQERKETLHEIEANWGIAAPKITTDSC